MSEQTADSSAHWLNAERIRIYSVLIVAIVGVVAAWWIARSLPSLVDPHGKPVGYDFITFWSAARLALDGSPAAAFDAAAIADAQHQAVPAMGDMLFLWHYPPTFLLLVLPLGLLSYPAALIAFSGATAALWAGLTRTLFRDPRAWLVAAATPAGLVNLIDGQNGFLTAGLAGFALVQLDRRPRLAGTLIGLLAIKPHLGVLFPVAFIAGRRWQTFVCAAVTAIVFTLAGVAAFGLPTTVAFLRDLPSLRDIVDRAGLPWGQMPSPYVLMLSLRAPSMLAALVQGVTALAAAVCVWRAWRRDDAPFEARAAVLMVGSLLVSPYLFTYDWTWLAVALAFLAVLGLRDGFGRYERDMLFAAWLAPLALMPLYWLLGVQLGCAMLIMTLAIAIRRLTAAPYSSRRH
ncbi:MAG TPA: glycosyltransferase family 87 protein [Stellaceae bacterium]|nr:glycosyltransferase family 87 protein [Stellaceae bacterium]